MGTNTLTDVISGTIQPAHINDIHTALKGDFVPRNSSGVAENLAGSLGTPSLQWLQLRAKNVFIDGKSIGNISIVGVIRNKVLSGTMRSSSNQPAFLVPAGIGNGASCTILGTTTDLIYNINDLEYTLASDLASGSLTTAPSTNNTALVNDASAGGTNSTRTYGEPLGTKEYIDIDTVGSEITGRVGKYHAFQIDSGGNTEYFFALIESTSKLSNIFRGYFYDDSIIPINRIVISNNDTITLLNTAWLFLTTTGTLSVTYNNPSWSSIEPPSPSTGDYWYDFSADEWKRYNGVAFVSSNATFIGMVILDDTDCIGARCVDFAASYSRENNAVIQYRSVTEAMTLPFINVNSAGVQINTQFSQLIWDITADLAGSDDMYSSTEQASTAYYLYVDELLTPFISDIHPYYRPDLFGFYHPHNPWRCLGFIYNDSGSDFSSIILDSFPSLPSLENIHCQSANTTTSQTLTTGSGFEKLLFSTANNALGWAIDFDLTNDQFSLRLPGTYDVFMRCNQFSGAAALTQYDYRLYDTTNSVSVIDFGQGQVGPNTNNHRNTYASFGTFEATDLSSVYEFQADVSGTNGEILGKQIHLVRRVSLHKGWVSA